MIETADLLLRSGSPEDGDALWRNLWRHEDVFAYLFSRPSPDREHALRRTAAYTQMHTEVPTEFFVIERSSGEAIGIAGVKPLAPGHWTITDVALSPFFQGRGYGRQIIDALTELAFQSGAEDVAYDCFCGNERSRRLALRCGFRFMGVHQAESLKNGREVLLERYLRPQ